MAARTTQDIRRELDHERRELADAVHDLRGGVDLTGPIRSRLPLLAAGALGAGFLLSGGLGATLRLLARRSREGKRKAQVGRFRVVSG